MKKSGLILVAVLAISCGKNTGAEIKTEVKNYRGIDGSRSQATIENPKSGKQTLELVSQNGKKIQLDLKSDSKISKIFERNGITAEVKPDSLIIKQGETIIPLSEIK